MTSSDYVDNNSMVQPGDLSKERGERIGQKGVMTKTVMDIETGPTAQMQRRKGKQKKCHAYVNSGI